MKRIICYFFHRRFWLVSPGYLLWRFRCGKCSREWFDED